MPKNEVDAFLSDVGDEKEEKVDSFIPDESDPLADKPGDTKDVKDEGKDEGDEKPMPFHKDPKVLRFIQKEIDKATKGAKPAEVAAPSDTTDELTDVLVEIVGNDTPQKVAAVKKLRAEFGRLEERGAERAISQLREQAEAERAEEAQAEEELITGFENIEQEFGTDLMATASRKERSEFIDFIKRVSPKDQDGDVIQYPDLVETYRLFKSTQKPNDNRRAKDLSSRSMSRSTDAVSAPVKGNSWKDVDKAFSKLQN